MTEQTTETDEEQRERWQREAEEAQAQMIQRARRTALIDLAAARRSLNLMQGQLARLGEVDLYDVDYADSRAPEVVADALRTIHVGLAAIENSIPKPEAP